MKINYLQKLESNIFPWLPCKYINGYLYCVSYAIVIRLNVSVEILSKKNYSRIFWQNSRKNPFWISLGKVPVHDAIRSNGARIVLVCLANLEIRCTYNSSNPKYETVQISLNGNTKRSRYSDVEWYAFIRYSVLLVQRSNTDWPAIQMPAKQLAVYASGVASLGTARVGLN